MKVGTLVLHRCPEGTRWLCGKINRRSTPPAPRSAHRDRVPLAAGPEGRRGQAAAGGGGRRAGVPVHGHARTSTRAIYGPLLRNRDCCWWTTAARERRRSSTASRSQRYTGVSSGPGFPGVVAVCARAIERRYRRPGRPPVHAADLFATAYAADDLEAVLSASAPAKDRSLRRLLRHLLRAVVHLAPPQAAQLGGARLRLSRAWARPLVRVVGGGGAACFRRRVRARCRLLFRRTRQCHGAPGRPRCPPAPGADRRPDARLRRQPGAPARGHSRLVDMVQDAASEPIIYREMDASVRAALAGDRAPLLRLVAQSQSYLPRREPGRTTTRTASTSP